MNISTIQLEPNNPVSPKKQKKSEKRKKRSGEKHKKRSAKSEKRKKRSAKSKKHRNPYEYNIVNQISQFYEMTLAHLSSFQKGFLSVANNSIMFNKGGIGTELYLKNLEEMPWWTFKLADVKQKLPIASPLLVGPLTFKMTFTQADKNAEIERRLTIQNGNLYLIKDYLLNLK